MTIWSLSAGRWISVDSCPNLTVAIEKLHRTYFGGEHQILYLMDSLEKEDAFYSLKNGYLKRRAGYYIYYAQNRLLYPL